MEIGQVFRSVCRSTAVAAAAARPSLVGAGGARPSTSAAAPGILLLQQQQSCRRGRQFTTSGQPPSEAMAASQTQPHPSSSRQRVEQLGASLPNYDDILPPRPPPIRRNNFFLDPQRRTPAVSSTTTTTTTTQTATQQQQQSQQQQQQQQQQQSPTGTSTSSADEDPFRLPDSIKADMEQATAGGLGGGLRTWNEEEFLQRNYGAPEPELRLRPSTGRTVHVGGQVDVARAFRLLQKVVTQNNVKKELFLQRAHERPALKRKRLKRERWQSRFKHGFRATIARVMELKAQGW